MLTGEQREILPEEFQGGLRILPLAPASATRDMLWKLLDALATALLDLKETREVLKDVEFGRNGFCPSCNYQGHKHSHFSDCKLAKNLPEGE